MAAFEAAIPVLMEHEGGIADIGDGEGITAFGWTLATCRALGVQQPKTPMEAEDLYREHFWMPVYDKIASQNVATKVFDDAVNQGHGAAHKMLQRALCEVGCTVIVDGVIGPATLTAVNAVPEAMLLPYMRRLQYRTYDAWVKRMPSKRERLRGGLANRAAWPDPGKSIKVALLDGTYQPQPPGGNNAPTTST